MKKRFICNIFLYWTFHATAKLMFQWLKIMLLCFGSLWSTYHLYCNLQLASQTNKMIRFRTDHLLWIIISPTKSTQPLYNWPTIHYFNHTLLHCWTLTWNGLNLNKISYLLHLTCSCKCIIYYTSITT